MTSTPSIACIGIIGKYDNPLHISLFPPTSAQRNAYLDFSFILHASLDLFDLKTRNKNSDSVDQDLGLLQHIDERLSIWGWETGTGIRIAIIVDRYGRDGAGDNGGGRLGQRGVEAADMRPAFKALQTAYIRLLQNPFYTPDEHSPMGMAGGKGRGDWGEIKSKRFVGEVRRVGEVWRVGMTTV